MEWLNRIFEAILRWFPVLVVIPETHAAVAFVRGKARLVGSGEDKDAGSLCLYWPMWTDLQTIATNRQTLDLRGQAYMTADGKSIVVSGVIVYYVHDPKRAILIAEDIDAAIRDITLGAILRALDGLTLKEIYTDRDGLDSNLRTAVAEGTQRMGVKILNCFLSDLAPCRVFRLVGDGGGAGEE